MESSLLTTLKKVTTPIVTLIGIAYLIFGISPDKIWFSFEINSIYQSFYTLLEPWIWIVTLLLILILISEIFTHTIIKTGNLDLSHQSFVLALKQRDWYGLFIQFPSIILFEEIIFRALLLYYFNSYFSFSISILLSMGIFGLYHLHILLGPGGWKITLFYVGYSFLLGGVLGFLFPLFGLIGAWLYHMGIVIYIYLRWYSYQMSPPLKEAETRL